jgi:hypothetical protein
MRLLIVGVGQTFNFKTRQMEDMLQVETPDGSMLSIPTTNEAAQALVNMAMNGEQATPAEAPAPPAPGYPGALELAGRVEERFEDHPDAGDFPDGAEVFGGDQKGEAEPVGVEDQEEPGGLGDAQVEQQIFAKTQRTNPGGAGASLGRRRNPADRSGVPSHSIARVDEKGNPILPEPPDVTMDDEEDPGEQV